MIYKCHDLRLEKQHIRIVNLETGVSWTEDTIKDAKHEIDIIYEIRKGMAEVAESIQDRLSE